MSADEDGTHNAVRPRPSTDGDRLTVDRLPGEHGPYLRCTGELTLGTADILRVELERLESIPHPVVVVNLSGCRRIDVDGLLTLLLAARRLGEAGRKLTLVAENGVPARLLYVLGIDAILPVFPSEEVAGRALRGAGPPLPAPESWSEARDKTLERWRVVESLLDSEPEEALRQMTSMFALCERAEELYLHRREPAYARCQFCPLFAALGGQDRDLGCRSVLEPMVEAVRAGDRDGARAKIRELAKLIAALPLPDAAPRAG